MSVLHIKQTVFSVNLARLVLYADIVGYEITFGEVWRTPEQAKFNADKHTGIVNSLHLSRLAADLNVFRDGVFLTESSELYPLGQYWKALHELNRWGGDFHKPDGNHFSMEHDGIK